MSDPTGPADPEQTISFLRRNIERLAQAGPEVGFENWARHLSTQMLAVIDSRHPDVAVVLRQDRADAPRAVRGLAPVRSEIARAVRGS